MDLKNRRVLVPAIAGLAILALVGIFAWTQLKDGGASKEERTELRSGLRDAISTALAEQIDKTPEETLELLQEGGLLEAAEEADVDRQQILDTTTTAAHSYLQTQVEEGTIDEADAEQLEKRAVQVVGGRL